MSFSKDLILEDGKSLFYFRFLEWDTQFFNKKSYLLDIEKSKPMPSEEIKIKIKTLFTDSFITVKIDTSFDHLTINFLQECSFKYIDTEIQLEYDRDKRQKLKYDEDVEIVQLPQNRDLPYEELGSSFTLTRFHSDLNISKEKADLLWVNYIKTFEPSNTKQIFVAKYQDDIAGAILVNITEETIYFFFVAVVEKFRRTKVGSMLISKALDFYTSDRKYNSHTILTGTQVKNLAAMNFYLKNGFLKIRNTKNVFHYWDKAECTI